MRAVLFANRVVDPVRSMTGIGRYVEGLTAALAARGEPGWCYDVSAPSERGRPQWLPPGVGYRPVPGPRKGLHLAWTLLHQPRLERVVGPADLVHVLHPSFPLPTRRPSVVSIHDVMLLEHPEWYQRDELWGFRRCMDGLAAGTGPVITVSADVAERLVRRVGIARERITVVPLAVGDEFRRPAAPADIERVCRALDVRPGRFLLAVGNLSTRKNLDTLVRAMARVQATDLPLVLAGRPGTSATEVGDEIRRHGVGDRVRLAGFVADADLPALVQGALALVHPAVDEGFGLPPLEAMAAGTAVIAARAGSIPEVVGGAALLVDPLDAAAWTEAIDLVAADGDRRAAMTAAGRARAAAFTWQRVAEQTVAVHRSALG